MTAPLAIFWFRRDLRLEDNAGLSHALASGSSVLPIFIFDPAILTGLPPDDARVTFIHDQLQKLRATLEKHHGSSIALYQGKPLDIFKQLLQQFPVRAVYANHDYEPDAQARDEEVRRWLHARSVPFNTYKDHVVSEKAEITKEDGRPYMVFTPYMRKWKTMQNPATCTPYQTLSKLANLVKDLDFPNLALSGLGFVRSSITTPAFQLNPQLLQDYAQQRDFPALSGTSLLSPHLRFGTVSIRHIARLAFEHSDIFCNELIWRDFFSQILWHFPHTRHSSFKPRYDDIQWRNNEAEFQRWCEGTTGYPLVDAGMRQLNATGWMHNRVRMVTASFLCKHLLIDWRWGEAYFAKKLLDYDMASNVGNWQWAAGCGVDAAPYFRIFNPTVQVQKFDKNLHYIHTWITEWNSLTYAAPIIDHAYARERCLKAYRQAVG
ncbi:deoxyribodipyrimidine photo-lyase [Nitrosomonas sp. JL21]|nr:deoxyribodipyrimidine photo-lyase [Nitrosomonas sp.]MXS77352.1 deoxyribodipyrimidine photo-lyase [Nitrosomonas sp. JL21]